MPDPSQMSPGMLIDPDDYVSAQRYGALAQALSQRALTPPSPQGYGGAVARMSPLGILAQGLTGYMARKSMDKGTAAQQRLSMALMQAQNQYLSGGMPGSSQSASTQPTQGDGSGASDPAATSAMPAMPATSATGQAPGMNPYARAQIGERLGISPNIISAQLAASAPTEAVKNAQQMGVPMSAAANKTFGIDTRPGGMVIMPDGSRIRNPNLPTGMEPDYDSRGNITGAHGIPGVTQYQGQLTGVETGAKEANTPQAFPNATGGTTYGYPGDVAGVGPPPSLRPGAPGAPAAPQGTPQPPQQLPPRNHFPTQPTQPTQAAAPTAPQTSADPFAGAPKVPGYGGLGAPGNTDAMIQKARGEKQVELYQKYGGESDAADQQLLRIQEAQKALAAGINAGPGSAAMTHVQGYVHQLFPSLYNGEAASNTQIFNKNAVNNALIGAKQIYGPRMTASEVMLQKNEANPSAEMTNQAIGYLMNQQSIVAQYNRQRAADYQAYVASGHDPLRFEGWYSANKPLQQFALKHDTGRQVQLAQDRGVQVPEEAFRRLNTNPQLKDAFAQKYGYSPDGY